MRRDAIDGFMWVVLVGALGWGLVAAPAAAQHVVELPNGRRTQVYVAGVQLADGARALRPPRPRGGDLGKQRWWLQHRFTPWLAQRRAMNRVAGASVFSLYLGHGVHGALTQALVATIHSDFADALMQVRSRPRRDDARELVASVVNHVLRESVEGALTSFARCASTAEGLRDFTLRDRCLAGARGLQERVSRALGAPATASSSHSVAGRSPRHSSARRSSARRR